MKASRSLSLKGSVQDCLRLEAEAGRLVEQLKGLGVVKIILIGSLARGRISLFSDIDMVAVFDDQRSCRELTRWVYQNLNSREAVDVLAYNRRQFETARQRSFIRSALQEGKVLYERAQV